MKFCVRYFFWLLMFFPIGGFSAQDGGSPTVGPIMESQTEDHQLISYKETRDVKASFAKVLIVFLLMIALAYGGIRSLKFIQMDGFAGKRISLVKILESRKLDTKTNAHVISVDNERFLVVQNGHGVQVTRLESNRGVEDKIEQQG
jgi:flagellar biogenesis protein FliO